MIHERVGAFDIPEILSLFLVFYQINSLKDYHLRQKVPLSEATRKTQLRAHSLVVLHFKRTFLSGINHKILVKAQFVIEGLGSGTLLLQQVQLLHLHHLIQT